MRVSELMRLGAMLRPQVKHLLFKPTADGSFGSCALGAVAEAGGAVAKIYDGWEEAQHIINRSFGSLSEMLVPCPGCSLEGNPKPTPLKNAIVCLNNHHDWTREQIADWVETIEDELLARNHRREGACQTEVAEPSELVSA